MYESLSSDSVSVETVVEPTVTAIVVVRYLVESAGSTARIVRVALSPLLAEAAVVNEQL